MLLNDNLMNKDVIIFFAGWGMDVNPFKEMNKEDYNLEIVYNYCSSNLDNINNKVKELCNKNKDIHIVAWSMGVWIAYDILLNNRLFANKIKSLTFINGTFAPIDNNFGIPPIIYSKTLENLPKGLLSFNLRMCGTREALNKYNLISPKRDDESIITELSNINENYLKNPYSNKPLLTKCPINVIISMSDNIIPTKNQITFWEEYSKMERINVINIEQYHYPFLQLNNWDKIIKGGLK